jgi:hypothetical protein
MGASARTTSPYRYSGKIGYKIFCSNSCLENYKSKLIRDKELKKQKEIDEKAREKENRLQKDREIEATNLRKREESRILRERKKEDFKNDLNTVLNLFKSNDNEKPAADNNPDEIKDTSKQSPKEAGWIETAVGFIILIVLVKIIIRYFF